MTGSARENIRVDCRVRPLDDGERPVWHVEGNSISKVDASSAASASDRYTLDAVHDGSSDNGAVFERTVQGLVEQVAGGINATVCAYGQTASGKTHTMRGSAEDPGVIPRALRTLFQLMSDLPQREFLCRVSYLELYNECICDLLAPENAGLQIREAKNKQPFVAGLREEIVAAPEQALELLELGERHRRYGETKMNKSSSRSHAIFRVVVESWPRGQAKKGGAVRVAALVLADLAGSEKLGKTGAVGQRAKEGAAINKSLSQLGRVIKLLSEGSTHIPYRDSKLTRILQPSLGGNAKTALICTVSPAAVHAEETKSTLEFARRAKKVVNAAHVNEVTDDSALLRRQANEIEELRAQIAQLRAAGHQPSEEQVDGLVAQLRADLLRAEQAAERMRQAKLGIQAQLQAMAGVLEGAEQDKGRLLAEKEELENQAAWALEEKEEAEKEAEAMGEELRETQDELVCLKGELPGKITKEVKSRTRTLEAQLRQRERQMERQERTIKEQSARIAQLTAEVLEKDQRIAELRNSKAEVLTRQVQKRRLLAQPSLGGAAPAAAKKAKAGGSRAGSGGAENASPEDAPDSGSKKQQQAQRLRDMMSL